MAEINVQQREELHRAIWAIADELRGSVDGWDFKNYVLGTMFYRYLSERFAAFIEKDEHDAGNVDFSYAALTDEEAMSMGEENIADVINTIGFFLKPSELFCNVCKSAQTDANLNENLERIFRNIEASSKGTKSEKCFDGLFADFDVNNNRLGASVQKRNERLVKLLLGIRDMRLGNVTDHTPFMSVQKMSLELTATNMTKKPLLFQVRVVLERFSILFRGNMPCIRGRIEFILQMRNCLRSSCITIWLLTSKVLFCKKLSVPLLLR